jgi:hypothetical protein
VDDKRKRKRALLQFYFHMVFANAPSPRVVASASLRIFCAGVAVALAACATVAPPAAPTAPSPPRKAAPYVEPPPPPVNLQGFPPSYRLGFGDGCATGRGTEKKDPVRFGNDGNYRVGWQDGLAQCKAK